MGPQVATELSQAAAAAIAVARLTYLRLAPAFPALFAYLLFSAGYSLAFASLSPKSMAYFWVYVVVSPLVSVIYIFVVRELVALIFHKYPGIRTLGRWVLYGSVIVAAIISLAAARLVNSGYRHKKWGLYYIQSVERSVIFSLAIAIAAILFVISKYPLHLGRNTYVSSTFFSALFLSDALRLLVDSWTPQFFNHYVDWGEAFVITACLVAWAVMLQREPAPSRRVAFSNMDENRLLGQLEALNQLMTRAARR